MARNHCVRAADASFALAGTSALYETSPLQRRLRAHSLNYGPALASQGSNPSLTVLFERILHRIQRITLERYPEIEAKISKV
jgi:hypothetical protein